MKKLLLMALISLLLTGCSRPMYSETHQPATTPSETTLPTEAEPPEETSPEILLNIFVPDENAENFNTIPTVISTADAEEIVMLLIEHSILNIDISLNSAEIVGKQLNLDFSQTFADQLKTYGTSGERMMMGCVVNTFLSAYDAYDVESVYITVDGEILESGHVIYDFPMSFFE